jgi:hypothetical protein
VLEVPLQNSSPKLSAVAELELAPPMRVMTTRLVGFVVLGLVLVIGALAGSRWYKSRVEPPVVAQALPHPTAVVTAPPPPAPVPTPTPPPIEVAVPPVSESTPAVAAVATPIADAGAIVDAGANADAGVRRPGATAATKWRPDASLVTATPSSITTTTGATVEVYSPSHARVAVESTRAFGTEFSNVNKALDIAQMSQCYATSLAGVTARPQPVRRTMHVTTDESAHIESITLSGSPPMAQAESCILQVLRGHAIEAPEGTSVTADVDLAFLPE